MPAGFDVVEGISAYALHRAARLVGLIVVLPCLAVVVLIVNVPASSKFLLATPWLSYLLLAVAMCGVLTSLVLGPILGARREAAEKAAGYTSLQRTHQVYPQVLPGTGIVIREHDQPFLSSGEFRKLRAGR